MCLSDLGKETGIPLKADKLFYYDRNILENIRIVINSLGYKVYLDSNYDWKAYEESLNDNEKWKIVDYRRPTKDFNYLFRLYNRNKSSDIALPDIEELRYDYIYNDGLRV